MGLEFEKSYNDLQQELNQAKVTLVTLNDNIRRIVGRNHTISNRAEKHKIYDTKRTDSDRQSHKHNDGPKAKRRAYDAKSVFQRLSGPVQRGKADKEEERPRLNSRVIRELPTRQEIVAVQCADSESRERNRRMFGSLLGTLHKFTQEETRLKQKEEQKAQIEKKVEEQEIQERESMKKERETLFLDRKRKQMEIRKLELKMNCLKDFESWEKSISPLKHFIKTKTKPCIYFKPKVLNKKTEKLLKENCSAIESMIEKKREAFQKEMNEIENNLKLSENDLDFANDAEQHSEEGSKSDRNSNHRRNHYDEHKEKADVVKSNHVVKEDSGGEENNTEPLISSSVVVVANTSRQTIKNEGLK